ncbi:hypothetical protein [Photorhabdus sp. SF281]|uniref:hypothetical protein n=1 Tax=Photorhabdus sp. SF281 TaxID=3459527 RepID=UPI004044B6CD
MGHNPVELPILQPNNSSAHTFLCSPWRHLDTVVEKRMLRRDAARQLNLPERQTQRLMNRFRESGAAGLAGLCGALLRN